LGLNDLLVAIGADLDHPLVVFISCVGDPQHVLAGWN
jgi:hypothetical protein